MAQCDQEITVFEKDTSSAPKCQDAWKKYGSGGYVCYDNVYSNTTGRIKYKLPLSLAAKYLTVTEGHTYQTHSTTDYIFTLECTVIFFGFQSNAIKVKTCITPVVTPTPSPTPTPQTGSLRVVTTPTEATIRIDGETYWKRSNCTIPDMSVGYHSIDLMKSGYVTENFVQQIKSGVISTLSVILQKVATPTPVPTATPTPGKGNISCISNPDEATVKLNGTTFWKRTNCLMTNVSPGNYNIEFIKEGYKTHNQNINVYADQTKTVYATLIKVHDIASIKCTCNVSATVTLEGKDPHTTPHTYTGLTENKMYSIEFRKTGYSSATHFIAAKVGSQAHANLNKLTTFGFDINVNIPGLSSSQGKTLHVLEVEKIPGTDTWYHPPLFTQIKWTNVSNKPYIARHPSSSCVPKPSFHAGFRKNQDYAIFIGTSVLAFYPGKLVHRSTQPPKTVNLTDDYFDWLASRACGFIGVSPSQCSQWIGALAVDLMTPLADLYVIKNHRSLYTNEPEEPTAITYLCAAIGCIPVIGTIRHAGKLKYTNELMDLASISNKNSGVANALSDGNFISKIDGFSLSTLQNLIDAARRGDINNIKIILNSKIPRLNYITLQNTLLNLAEITGNSAAYKTMARAMGISEDGLGSLKLIKGASTGQLLLTSGNADDIIHLAGHVPDEFKKVVDNCSDIEIDGMIIKCKQSQHTPVKVMGSMVNDVKLVVKDFNPAPYETVETCIERLGKSAERVKSYPKGDTLYEEVVGGAVNSVKKMEPILEEGMKVDSVSELNKIIIETANNVPSSWRSKASSKLKSTILIVDNWTKSHPRFTIAGGMALWFLLDNVPFYVYIYLKSIGADPSSRSFQGKDHISVIDTYYWNVKEAEDIQNWTLFCSNLKIWVQKVNEFETFIETYKSTLLSEGTYDLYKGKIEAYRLGIELKNDVHACGLPSTFTATIDEYGDGDSLHLRINGVKTECRILGINTPESTRYVYSCTNKKEPYLVKRLTVVGGGCANHQTWNVNKTLYEASVGLIPMLLPMGSTVTVHIDPAHELDKYNRHLVTIEKNGYDIGLQILRTGLAVVYFYESNILVNTATYLHAEKSAKDAKTGVWKFEAGTGSIHCQSEDKTACDIWLDGQDTGEKTISSEFTLKNVLLGNHTVKFVKLYYGKYYECTVENVYVSKDQTANASCTLTADGEPTPIPDNIGSIYCRSTDSTTCDIWMDDVYTGHQTSSNVYLLKDVPIGSRKIKFVKWVQGIEYFCTTHVTVYKNQQATATCSLGVPTPPPSCPNPTASYVMSPSSPDKNQMINLNASDSKAGSGETIQSYVWLADNVRRSQGGIASFSISSYGWHTIQLIITNSCGETDSKTKIFEIIDPGSITCPNPTASYIMSPSSPDDGDHISLSAFDSNGGSNHFITLYEWYLNDVKIGEGITHTFTAREGNHLLKLKVTNDCGKHDYKTKSFEVDKPSGPSGKTGKIYCESKNYTACTIWLDGEYTGKKTSSNVALLEDIPIGQHTIIFKKYSSGYDYQCSIEITVQENKTVNAICILQRVILFPIYFYGNPYNANVTTQPK